MTSPLADRRILIMATDGFEQSELEVPRDKLNEAGATVHIASLKKEEIKGWEEDDWGTAVNVDLLIEDAKASDYDALVLPGGQINPDLLRIEEKAISLIQAFAGAQKPIAAICHAPWLLIEAGLAEGRTMTCYKSILTDLSNAGAKVAIRPVAVDGNFITSRCPDDLPDFCDAIVDALARVDADILR